MALPNIFTKPVTDSVIERIHQLTPASQPQWGKMNVAQMMAHCCVPYEMVFTNKHHKPNFLLRFVLKSFVKKHVINEVPYPHNSKTAPAFLVSADKDFSAERQRLVNYVLQTQQLGETHFDGKESLSFGPMSTIEWNNMFYKHLDHHLRQFGV
ncbi:uncharacterized protein DUF1569 [Chitinophaga skermanii]|uniref:Uncharacterized protein DUF1569 n=1 Tax=Chitinophaga skermanii TaxID=331697 RepID=A0A327Q9X6_9BACT|nr:DUF1569 domain-containing protein [Chitinophaga skermanii]RAJ00432.1 uncharacterized protein DUF1569 [Chitinophaga skermanii]